MANLSLGLISETPEGNFKITKKNKIPFLSKKFTRKYYVLGDSLSETETTIAATSGIPQLGDTTQGATCIDVNADEVSTGPLSGVEKPLWEVTCKFDNDVDTEGYDDPTERPIEVEWDGELQEIALARDVRNGKPIVTSAGEQVYATDEKPLPLLTLSRLEVWPFQPTKILKFVGRVNSEKFYDAPKGCALMLPIRARKEIIDDTTYANVTYRIKFNMVVDDGGNFVKDGWKLFILNNGYLFREEGELLLGLLDDGDLDEEEKNRLAMPKKFIDPSTGHPAKVNLDEVGRILGEDQDPTFSEYWGKLEIDFNQLNLGP